MLGWSSPREKEKGMDIHGKRRPQCISEMLSLTADISLFRVKYFKSKKKNPLFFKKGGLNIVAILMLHLNTPGYPQRFFFPLFLSFFPFSHLSLSTHLWCFQPFPELLLNYHKSVNEYFNATIFPVACGVSAEMNQDSSSKMRQKMKACCLPGHCGFI